MRYDIVRRIPGPIKALWRWGVDFWLFSDLASVRRYRQVLANSGPDAVSLHIRALDGGAVTIRNRPADARVLHSTFARAFHLPPLRLRPSSPVLILDLGANIGLTARHFASTWPDARIVAVEMDHENVELCRVNAAASARMHVVHAAIWSTRATVRYSRRTGDDGFAIGDWPDGQSAGGGDLVEVAAVTIDDVVAPWLSPVGPSAAIDFIKMDIEGAERAVLQAGGRWAARTKLIMIELHGDYTPDEAIADLRRLGFDAVRDLTHHECVVGYRPDL